LIFFLFLPFHCLPGDDEQEEQSASPGTTVPGTASELKQMRLMRQVDFDMTTPEKPPKSSDVILRGDSQAETLVLGEGSQECQESMEGTPKYVPSLSGKKPNKDKPVTLGRCRRLPSRMTATKSKAKKKHTKKTAEKIKTGASKAASKKEKKSDASKKLSQTPGMESAADKEESNKNSKTSSPPNMEHEKTKGSQKTDPEPKKVEQGSKQSQSMMKEKKDDSKGDTSKQPQPQQPPLKAAPSSESLTLSIVLNRAATSLHPDAEETQEMDDMDIDPDVLDALMPEPAADEPQQNTEKPKKRRDLKAHARRQKFYRSLVSPSLSRQVSVFTLGYVAQIST